MPTRKRGSLSIKEAADFMGISPATLRLWDRRKRLKARRDPKNHYRFYTISELQKFKENNKVRKYNRKPTL